MKRTSTPFSRPKVAKSTTSSSLTPRMSTALTFTGENPAAERGVDAVEHLVEGVAAGDGQEAVGPQRVAARC